MSVKECLGKTVSASRTEQAQILMYDTLNGYKRLFGGRLMEWIDVVAAVVARRMRRYHRVGGHLDLYRAGLRV